jgi:diadenosine tetraphosphatase ApaH/serine/threonine PP2A family protein phosphatase
MLIGIISDIHANLPALEAVLAALQGAGADTIYCLGDTVGYGPFPNECVDLVRRHCGIVLKGNHDSGLIGETDVEDFNHYGLVAIRWSQEHVTVENKNFLESLPLVAVKNGVTLAHASPSRPGEWSYILTLRAARDNFPAFSTHLCFIGHTHVPAVINEDLTIGNIKNGIRCIVNVGSVGQPRDGNRDAAYGLFDTATNEYSLKRVPYDIQKTADRIASEGLPEYLAKRLFQGV